MKTIELIDTLQREVKVQREHVKELLDVPFERLKQRKNENSWNVLECIEHLKRYSDYYLPQIESKVQSSKHSNVADFKSSFLGEFFVKQMDPQFKGKGMKTFTSKNPLNEKVNKDVILVFIQQLNLTITLLEQAKNVNLNKVKVKTTLPLLRFSLGDTFRFVIKHNERHLAQAQRVLALDKAL